jgi:deferrochelatase/peroxidase EfeB
VLEDVEWRPEKPLKISGSNHSIVHVGGRAVSSWYNLTPAVARVIAAELTATLELEAPSDVKKSIQRAAASYAAWGKKSEVPARQYGAGSQVKVEIPQSAWKSAIQAARKLGTTTGSETSV